MSEDWTTRHIRMKERELELDKERVDLKEREERIDAAKATRLSEASDVEALALQSKDRADMRRQGKKMSRLAVVGAIGAIGAPTAFHMSSLPFTIMLGAVAFVALVAAPFMAEQSQKRG